MSEIRITELAAITGFAPTTIRFYENTGLLPAASRSSSGRRVYGQHDVDRLRFIARGKQMGLALDEIRELIATRDADVAGAAPARVVGTIEARIAEVGERIVELSAFSAQLADTLRATNAESAPVVPAREMVCRGHWTRALAHPHTYRRVDEVLTVTFPTSPAVTAVLAALVTHESSCLQPSGILLRCTARTTTLEVTVAENIDQLVGDLFGSAAGGTAAED